MSRGLKTLVLNANYLPINVFPLSVIPVEDAVVRCFNGTCNVVYDYPIEIKTVNKNVTYKWPSVIARTSTNILNRKRIILNKFTLYYRDDGLCSYCHKPVEIAKGTMDHVMPVSRGGADAWENVVLSCDRCNQLKDNKLPVGEWKPRVIPYEPTFWNLLEKRKNFPLIIMDKRWTHFLPDWNGEIVVKDLKNGT